jgi:hypothetical protein
MSLGEIRYSESSLESLILETLKNEKHVHSMRFKTEIDSDNGIHTFHVLLTLNTFKNALAICKEYQRLAHEAMTVMTELPNIMIHIHLENIINSEH